MEWNLEHTVLLASHYEWALKTSVVFVILIPKTGLLSSFIVIYPKTTERITLQFVRPLKT